MSSEGLLEQLSTCKAYHTYTVSKIHTKPPQYKYECDDCDNVAVSDKLITT